MISARHENARLQSDFYRDQFRKISTWLVVSMLINIILIGVIIYYVLLKPAPVYYANTIAGKIMNMPRPR